jgi:hypothetical protein
MELHPDGWRRLTDLQARLVAQRSRPRTR